MALNVKRSMILGYVALALAFVSPAVFASPRRDFSQKPLLSFGLSGGYGQAEMRGGMIDLKAEVQFYVLRSLSLGMGVGYMSDFEHGRWNGADRHGDAPADQTDLTPDGHRDFGRGFRSIPITLTAYYYKTITRSVNVYLLGGGGYYLTDIRDASPHISHAWGAHAGLGVDVRLFSRFRLAAEGTYRFVSLRDGRGDIRPADVNPDEAQVTPDSQTSDKTCSSSGQANDMTAADGRWGFRNTLNGFSVRLGLKFGF
jgi:hypothetical protein